MTESAEKNFPAYSHLPKSHSESGGVFLDLYLAISLEKTIPTHAVNPVITPK